MAGASLLPATGPPQTEPGSPDLAVCVRGFLLGNGMEPDNPRQYLWTAVGFAVLIVVILLIYGD